MTTPDPVHGTHEDSHPGPRQYVFIAVVLAIVTLIEVAIYYVEAVQDLLVPFLIMFSLIKFVLVALYFMHLKFDSRLFRRLFVVGLVLAFAVMGIVLSTFLFRGGPAPDVTGALMLL